MNTVCLLLAVLVGVAVLTSLIMDAAAAPCVASGSVSIRYGALFKMSVRLCVWILLGFETVLLVNLIVSGSWVRDVGAMAVIAPFLAASLHGVRESKKVCVLDASGIEIRLREGEAHVGKVLWRDVDTVEYTRLRGCIVICDRNGVRVCLGQYMSGVAILWKFLESYVDVEKWRKARAAIGGMRESEKDGGTWMS